MISQTDQLASLVSGSASTVRRLCDLITMHAYTDVNQELEAAKKAKNLLETAYVCISQFIDEVEKELDEDVVNQLDKETRKRPDV